MSEPVWEYTFRLWPSFRDTIKVLPKTREILDMSFGMIEVWMTESEFAAAVEQLGYIGLSPHEVARRPYVLPETVLIGGVEVVQNQLGQHSS